MASKKALLIDDDERVLNTFSSILEGEDYQVITAKNGLSALEKLYPNSFDLIITSLAMKTGKGFTVLGMIKVLSPETPLIVFTDNGCSIASHFLPLLGTCAFITLPCSNDALVSCIRKAPLNGGSNEM